MNTPPRRRSRSPSRSSAGLPPRQPGDGSSSLSSPHPPIAKRHEPRSGAARVRGKLPLWTGSGACMEERRFGAVAAWAMSEENVEVVRQAVGCIRTDGDVDDAGTAYLRPDVELQRIQTVPGTISRAIAGARGPRVDRGASRRHFGKSFDVEHGEIIEISSDDHGSCCRAATHAHAARRAARRSSARPATGLQLPRTTARIAARAALWDQGRGPRSRRAVRSRRCRRRTSRSFAAVYEAVQPAATSRRFVALFDADSRVGSTRVPGLFGRGGLYRGRRGACVAASESWIEGLERTSKYEAEELIDDR